jgi:hypothetical protein
VAVGFILDFASGGTEAYDEVVERMGLEGKTAAGGLFHVAGAGPRGGIRVVDVWESDDAFEAFAARKIRPITAEVGLAPPQIMRFDVHGTRDSGAPRRTMRLFQVVRFSGLDEPGFDAMDGEILATGVPEAMVFHVNGPAEDGGWVVADGWTSREARDAFLEARVYPVAAKHPGITPPRIEDFDVHATLEPAAPVAGAGTAGGAGGAGG